MTVTLTERELAQRHQALEHANWTRARRAELKHDLKEGRCAVVDVLANPPEFVLTMTLLELLLAVPRVGRDTATRLLSRCSLSPAKQLGETTERQRRVLCGVLRGTGGQA